jgi:PPOX class probable F420-dependent enzyme
MLRQKAQLNPISLIQSGNAMISTNEKFDEFISAHRWAVLTTLRGDGQPSNSVVAYARDGDELVISTPGGTFKRRAIESDERVNLCVISNAEPFNFVAMEATAVVTRDNLEEDTKQVFDNLAGTWFSLPEDLPQWLATQQRVILRLRPGRVHGVIR